MSYTKDKWFEHYQQKYGNRSHPPEVFHIGYHKTGTTFVQKSVLNQLSPKDQQKILSHEGISGSDFKDDLACAHQITKLNPDAKIIITIRSQISMYPSYYWLYVKRGGTLPLDEFIDICLKNRRFDYSMMVQHLLQTFPSKDIKIIPFELIKTNKTEFVESYLDFALGSSPVHIQFENTPKNKSPGKRTIQTVLLINQTVRKSERTRKFLMNKFILLNGLFKRSPTDKNILDPAQTKKIAATYQKSNQELQEYVDWNLKELGYPI